jgi:hypothetical protein
MKFHGIWLCIWIAVCLCLSACSSRSPVMLKSDESPDTVKVIALLPVESNAADSKALKMLRNKLGEELRFKGYPQLDSELIDSKLMSLAGAKELKNDVIPPNALEKLLGADAAMYCSLLESKTSISVVYAPVTVTVRCDLRSTKTGDTIWSAQSKSTNRSFDLIHERLQMKSLGDFEKALEEVVGKVMETLPYGPRLRG